MKYLNNKFLLAVVSVLLGLTYMSCREADEEFIHDNNLLSDVRIKTNPSAEGMSGVIYEYDAEGQLVPTEMVTVKAVEGGYGRIVFELDPSYRGVYDPERCYLSASLTFDEIIRPGLGGIKNITNRNAEGIAQGIDVIVTSGTGSTRRYNIIGYFEGEYQINPDQQ